jgi:RNA polymerase sigma-70 factor (ECF subfamily)
MGTSIDELLPTRATLIQRLKDWQDQASWQDFFDTYWTLIYKVAVGSGLSRTEAQDVVQEIIVAVAKQMPTFQYDPTIGSFKSWLLNMTRWRIRDHIRNQNPLPVIAFSEYNNGGKENETQAINRLPDSVSRTVDELWNAEWEKNLLDAAVSKVKRKLDPFKYQVFDFYVNKGWPPGKVASTFNLPVEQVYMIKHRVTEMVKEEVMRLEIEMK